MENKTRTSLFEKISQNLLKGALPVAAISAATKREDDGKSKIRVSSLETLANTKPVKELRGLQVQTKRNPLAELAGNGNGNGAKIVDIKSLSPQKKSPSTPGVD